MRVQAPSARVGGVWWMVDGGWRMVVLCRDADGARMWAAGLLLLLLLSDALALNGSFVSFNNVVSALLISLLCSKYKRRYIT